jgi:amidohydrolase/hippurate hydrolase
MSKLQDFEKGINREIVEVWHHLHQNPELSMEEHKTADFIEKKLRETTGADRIKRVGKTGLWVELKGTAPREGEERIVVLRGDMDALPIQEANELPYRSVVPGVMHACGHDVHTSALLGAVRVLEQYRDRIPGTIWFFFQPGEETLKGALTFLEDPEIDFTKPKAIAGIHVGGDLAAGKIRLRVGAQLASADLLRFRVTGQSGHAASPQKSRDPIVAAAHLIVQLQTLVSRELKPVEAAVLSLCLIQGGSKDNIIAQDVRIEGTLRTLSKENRVYFLDAIRRICQGVALSLRVSIDFEVVDGSIPLVSDAGCVKIAEAAAKKSLGEENIEFADHAEMGGEDFAFFADKIPGVFIIIGAKSRNGPESQGHSPQFYTDESAIHTGILTLSSFALEFFGVDFDI